jgi:NADH-quinone oxidoreductase subunit N
VEQVFASAPFGSSFDRDELFGLAPEIFLLGAIIYLFIKTTVAIRKPRSRRAIGLIQITAYQRVFKVTSFLYLLQLLFHDGSHLAGDYLMTNGYVVTIKLAVILTALFVLSNSDYYVRYHPNEQAEYPNLLAFTTLCLLLLVGSAHLFAAFFSLVGFSLTIYVLLIHSSLRSDTCDAGSKYYFLSAFSSGLLLAGVGLTYYATGTAQYYELDQFLGTDEELALVSPMLGLAVVATLGGFFFKLSAFPGHQ